MSATSSIEWTDRTWNPVRGCSLKSPGCVNCYAMKQAHRFSGPGRAYEGLTKLTKAGPQWTGIVRPVESALLEPLSWRKPSRVFVNSMSDLFHEDVPDAFIDRVFAVMAVTPRHTYQILTKRPDRMLRYMTMNPYVRIAAALQHFHPELYVKRPAYWPFRNVWLGVSVEDRLRRARIDELRRTPAAVRFISFEPLLEDVSDGLDLTHIDWAIWGGESGHRARPSQIDWYRRGVASCRRQGVVPFLKQLGSAIELQAAGKVIHGKGKNGDPACWPEDLRNCREFPMVGA